MLCDATGNPKHILNQGERKSQNTDKVKLVLGDTSEIETVKIIFNMYAMKKMGMISIARELTKRGIPSPSSKFHYTANNASWGVQVIDRMLKNKVYYGAMVYGKRKMGKFSKKENLWDDKNPRKHFHDEKNLVIIEDSHESIITKELFETVQRIRASKPAFKKGSKGRTKDSPYLLTGLLVCGNCNHNFSGWSPVIDGKKFEYYKDNGKQKKGFHFCEAKNINRAKLDNFTINCISERLLSDFWFKSIKDKVKEKLTSSFNAETHLIKAENELEQVKKEMDNLYDTIAIVGNNETLIKKLQDRQSKLNQLNTFIELHKSKDQESENTNLAIEKYMGVIRNMKKLLRHATNDEKKLLVRGFVNKAVYKKELNEVEVQFYNIPEFETYASHNAWASQRSF